MNHLFPYPKMGKSWLEILEDPLTRKLLGHDAVHAEKIPFVAGVHSRFKYLLQDPLKHLSFAKIGYTALEAFLQANCTGPPLDFDSIPVIIPEAYRDEIPQMREDMLKSLSVDGIDVYPLTPRIELFWLAKCLMDNATLAEEGFNGRRARMRINFWHQKLLPETSDTLRNIIYHDASVLDSQMSSRLVYGGAAAQEHMVEFLVERGTIRIHYKDEELGREDLLRAAKLRDFEFAITGILGKKTKYQVNDVSQLVVVAKSRDHEPEPYSSRKSSRADTSSRKSSIAERSVRSMSLKPITPGSPNSDMGQMFSSMAGALSPTSVTQPENIPLNDDTLFENIQFNPRPHELNDPATDIVTEQSHLPITLAFMDPNEQPQLFPMDAIILLAIAESITNTSPDDGLTREQSLPYATRVLEGGSSNWAVYSLALLIRSRIEGHQSRTAERALLQLQALVDQVISETSHNKFRRSSGPEHESSTEHEPSLREVAAAILPATAEEDERSTVAERLRFIHQVSPPLRWELEAELAARWTQMGGLRTALEIYQRLQMTPEVALCLAATDREAEAVKLLKKTLFVDPDQEMKDGDAVELLDPLPAEAPRLLCILGDIQSQPKYYNLAWTVSGERYARAKRSLGKFYVKKRDLVSAVESYEAALRIARQDQGTWFSLGCVFLELEDWQGAVETFSRVVQLDDKDAQAWSNLAVSLLRLPVPVQSPKLGKSEEPKGLETIEESTSDDEGTAEVEIDPLQHTREALRALRRAAHLKREDARIWDNYLTVAASIPPDPEHPERTTPWQEVILAMSHVIGLRHKKEGERCVDLKILEALLDHVTSVWDYPTAEEEEANGKGSSENPPTTSSDTHTESKDKDTDISNTDDHRSRSRSGSRSRQHSPDSPPSDPDGGELDIVRTLQSEVPRIPFLVRALTTMIDTQISPLATSSPQLFLILSHAALWRHRPAEALSYIEKSWRATTNSPRSTSTDLVEATGTLLNAYKTLGPMERERTGGLVEKGWRFKSRTAVRSTMGKAKGVWDGGQEYKELEDMMEFLKVDSPSGGGQV